MKRLAAFLCLFVIAGCSFDNTHVSENVPDSEHFDQFLKRDLTAYFDSQKKGNIQVQYELLRKIATQAGTSYPKFYAWVRVFENDSVKEEGAARIEAFYKTGFHVTHFVSKSEIRKKPRTLESIFPKPLIEKILYLASTFQ